jgi:RNA polymerase sigma factor (sigma-70 family)
MRDFELLQEYAVDGSDAAFSALVSRYANLVYSAALRQTGDWHTAQDIAQAVFITLASKAAALPPDVVLSGWLLRTTRFVSLNARRRELHQRRLQEEALNDSLGQFDAAWSHIAPVIDEALVELPDKDRDAVALRFFEQKSFREIGNVLGTSEDGAHKRVFRALDKLRVSLVKKGVALSATMIVGATTTKSVQAAPAHLAAALANGALGASAGGPATALADDLAKALQAMRRRATALKLGALSLILLLGFLTVRRILPPASPRKVQTARTINARAPAVPPAAGLPAPALPANLGQLLLHVIDAQTGLPIPNARLTQTWDTGLPFGTTNVLNTDAKGEASLSISSTKEELWSLRVDILRDGYIPKFVSWAAARGDLLEEMPADYTAKLERGTFAGGTVMNENGEPIPDVKIVVAGSQSSSGVTRSMPTREGDAVEHIEVTDSQGRWLCNHLPVQLQPLSFRLVHQEYRTATFHSATVSTSSDASANRLTESDFRSQLAVMVMNPGRKVTGLITSDNGEPLLGAKVTRRVISENSAPSQTTGPDGRFNFGDADEEKFILTVEAPGYQFTYKTIEPQDQLEDLRFSLEKSDGFHAKVLDEAGHPIAGAWVLAVGDPVICWKTLTGAGGLAEWSSAPAKAKYRFQADGYKAPVVELPADGVERPVTLNRTVLRRGVRITGSAVDSQSRLPIEHFEVWSAITVRQQFTSGVWNNLGFAPALRTTGQNGKFAFLEIDEGLGAIEADDVAIKAEGYLPARQTIRGPLTNAWHLDFELTAVGMQEGTVFATDGTPAHGAIVMLCAAASSMTSDWTGAYMDTPGQLDLKLSGASRAETGPDGDFKIQTRLSSGLLVAAHKLGFAELKFDHLKGPVVLRLQPWSCVEGTLRIGSQPGANKTVWIHKVQQFGGPLYFQAHLNAITDGDGRFSFEGVPPGEWETWPHNVKLQVVPGQTNRLSLGGMGRKVIGRITGGDPNEPYDKRGYRISLATKSFAEPPPLRIQFDSLDDYLGAKSAWSMRSMSFQHSEAGRRAQPSRSYSPQIQPDGTFAIDEVLPGDYSLSIAGDPLRHDPLTMDALENIFREVVVSGLTNADAATLDIGGLEVNVQTNTSAR